MDGCWKIISDNKAVKTFRCKRCKISHNILYKINGKSYCEKCVTKDVKEKAIIVNQCREEINNENWNVF